MIPNILNPTARTRRWSGAGISWTRPAGYSEHDEPGDGRYCLLDILVVALLQQAFEIDRARSDFASIIARSPIGPSPVLVAPQSTRRSDRDFLPPTLGRLIGGLLFLWRADRHRPETAFQGNLITARAGLRSAPTTDHSMSPCGAIYGIARKAARSSSSAIGFCNTAATFGRHWQGGVIRDEDDSDGKLVQFVDETGGQLTAPQIIIHDRDTGTCSAINRSASAEVAAGPMTSAPSDRTRLFRAIPRCQESSTTRIR